MFSRGRAGPKRERDKRLGISSERCVMSAGAKAEIRDWRCVPEKVEGVLEMEVR
jgi:hypothetical protein